MKKTSIFLATLLVVSLLFAVSCPNKDPSINVTSTTVSIEKNLQDVDKNISFDVTIDLVYDTFSDSVTTDASVLDWFNLSDGTETEKVTLTSANVKSVSEKKDSATVALVAEAKTVTEVNKPVKLTVIIPATTAETTWTTSKKAVKEARANNIAITIIDNGDTPTPPASKKVTAEVSNETIEFTESTVSTDEKSFKITLKNGEFVNENDVVITGNGVTSGHISFTKAVDSNNKNVLNVSVSATATVATTDGGDYTITVKVSAIKAVSSDYTAEEIVLIKNISVKEKPINKYATVTVDTTKTYYTDNNVTVNYNDNDGTYTYENIPCAIIPIIIEGAEFVDSYINKWAHVNKTNMTSDQYNYMYYDLNVYFNDDFGGTQSMYFIIEKQDEEGKYLLKIATIQSLNFDDEVKSCRLMIWGYGNDTERALTLKEGWTYDPAIHSTFYINNIKVARPVS